MGKRTVNAVTREGLRVRVVMADAPRLVDRIVNRGLRQLSDGELVQVVSTMLNQLTYRAALRGNARFL
jgi:hypothetical protein